MPTISTQKALHDEWLKTAIDYKMDWEHTLGIVAPEPIPHPDDIIVDLFTGEVTFKGPLAKEQKDAQDQLVAMRPGVEKSIRLINRRLVKNPDNAERSPNTS